MNTFHRFLVAGGLVLSVFYVGNAMAEQIATGQQPPQYYGQQPYGQQPYAQPPKQKTYNEIIKAKAVNGAINASPASLLEMPKAIINNMNAENSNFVFGVVGGVLEGGLHAGTRIVTGAVDLVTFMIPTKPITQPLYIWDDFDETNTYGQVFRLDQNGNASHFEMPGNSNAVQMKRSR